MTNTTFPQAATSDGPSLWRTTGPRSEAASSVSGERPRVIVVPASQRYYWTRDWQRYEAEAEAEIRAGGLPEFDSIEGLARDLLSEGD